MGASQWSYFVPYRADVAAALEALKEDVFSRGEYAFLGDDVSEAEAEAAGDGEGSRPGSIEELLEINEDMGTHSILDMVDGVSEEPGFGTVSPLDGAQLAQHLGTATPAKEQIEAWLKRGAISSVRGRWEGAYLLAYRDGKPAEICFAGFSGD